MPSSINNNLMAANVANNLSSHYGRFATSVERLSSGLRINSAADDAAGLAISELMRADVAALYQGVRNINDAISLIQTADGALNIIDEKLIRMKELAEQAATGTYNSTQRLMIHSEFVAMAEEIDRIARATDFNGIKLLDGSLSGTHDGSGMNSTGKMKIHFGTANDSAEDYYYVEIGDCTTSGLGLRNPKPNFDVHQNKQTILKIGDVNTDYINSIKRPPLNDFTEGQYTQHLWTYGREFVPIMQDHIKQQGTWYFFNWVKPGPPYDQNLIDNRPMFIIPKGTKNIVINVYGAGLKLSNPTDPWYSPYGDQDIQLFTKSGIHLAGTTLDDIAWNTGSLDKPFSKDFVTQLQYNTDRFGFSVADYDDSYLNTGPLDYDPDCVALAYSTYNGMSIGYSGDPDRHDDEPNDGKLDNWDDFEVLTIDEATEDLILYLPGISGLYAKFFWDLPNGVWSDSSDPPGPTPLLPDSLQGDLISIKTQEEAQQALTRIDDAIVAKDKVRAHLGSMQNRLENSATNITTQAENLQAAESRISDADIANEMTIFVHNQILTQSAVAMLGQANSYPHMLMKLLRG